MTPAIDLRDVSRTYGRGDLAVHAIRGVDLIVAPGELVCVMGPSGSGKSTLLALAAGLERPDAGAVFLHGESLSYGAAATAARLRRTVGVVYQELNLLADLTAIENVALPLELDGRPRSEARDFARAALADVELAGRGQAYPDDLSGGEQQRVAVARALVGGRSILIADEPTGALDSLTGEAIVRLIRRRCDDGATALVATHDAAVAACAHRVVFLRDGGVTGVATGVAVAAEVRS